MGANAGSIGIEHVGSETDSLAPPQAAASAAPDPLVAPGTSDCAHEYLRPRFRAGLLPTGRNQLSGQALRPSELTSHDRSLGRG